MEPVTRPADRDGEHPDGEMVSQASHWYGYVGFGAVVVAIAQVLPGGPLRAVIAAPVLLLLPGFLLLRLAMRRVEVPEGAVQVVFAAGLSVALILADALLLNAAGVQLEALSLGLAALASSLAIAAIGIFVGAPIEAPLERVRAFRDAHDAARWTVATLSATLLVVVGVWVAVGLAPAPAAPSTVSFSLGSSYAGLTEALTTTPGQPLTIPVTAAQDHGTGSLDLELSASVDGHAVVAAHAVTVPAQGAWSSVVRISAPTGPLLHKVEIDLTPSSGKGQPFRLIVYLLNRTA